MQTGTATDTGKIREKNEDNFFAYDNGWLTCGFVADGMGGHEVGEVASRMAVDIIGESVKNDITREMDYVEAGEALRKAFINANYAIYDYSVKNMGKCTMGCTATAALIYMDKLITVHVGDSRVYKIDSGITQVTKDHSYVQELVSRGEITKEEAKTNPNRKYITRAMGTEESIKADVSISAYNGESILVCSDGLTNMVDDEDIRDIILNNENADKAAEILVEKANDNGGTDNITVVILKNN